MSEKKAEKRNLDHEVWKLIKEYNLKDQKILIAFSGGVDSTALVRVLSKIHKPELLGLCYYHHGEDSNREYRKEAQVFTEKFAKKWGLTYFHLKSSELAKSEAQYRDLRYAALSRLMEEQGFTCLATGHHQDDLLETRLMRLIRGTGGQGLHAMYIYKAPLFRPFLETSKKELKKYLREEKIRAFEDPSNASLDPLRNWIRQDWLKALDKKSAGASGVFARSLETIARDLESSVWGELLSQNEDYKTQGLSRAFYLTLSPIEQRRMLAQYLFSLGKKDFTQSHLEEVQKRLDNSKKVITFKVAGFHWEINAEQIKVQS
ncbi:tRNA lysidine(34) synthetase TilS [Bdellovibrio sp. HCB2-146]|uniref:tRNA lysidine(34) synthetase TilS n=1 Tax=Bdellovibrio sp. HCB2-146 TaxID=3394362 RepID=UPI0039BC3289